jgi:hypothetical protein
VIRALVTTAAVGAALLVPGAVALQASTPQPNDISWEAPRFSQAPSDINWHKTAMSMALPSADINWH